MIVEDDNGVGNEDDNTNDSEVEEDGEAVTKKTRVRIEPINPKEIPKTLNVLKKYVKLVKRRTNVKKNIRLFEYSARDPNIFNAILEDIEAVRGQYKAIMMRKKRVSQCRYLMPIARKFVDENKLSDEQPSMPRLSKGKGVLTRQAVTTYVYGYLRMRCKKIGVHEYELDDNMKELVEKITGEARNTLAFATLPGLLTKLLVSGVEVLKEDSEKYGGVLEHFARMRLVAKQNTIEIVEDNEEEVLVEDIVYEE